MSIKKKLKKYDDMVDRLNKVDVGDLTKFVSFIKNKRGMVASQIGKKK